MVHALRERAQGLIAIDGWHGSGKSWLSRSLGVCLQRPRFDLDTALSRNKGGFVDHLNWPQIQSIVDANSNLILSGICMREVLERLGRPAATFIYVKRMHHGTWTRQAEAKGEFGDYCLIDKFAEPGPLELEVRRYHLQWAPHETADVIFEREVSRRTGL